MRGVHVVEALLRAYRAGYFPMGDNSDEGGDGGEGGEAAEPMRWFNPDPRAIMPLGEDFHISSRLAAKVRSGLFEVTTDTAFEEVIRACSEPRPPPGEQKSWIDERIVEAYTALHRAGHAHSIEAWAGGVGGEGGVRELVGGLYGVHIGAAFFAESKFYRPGKGTDASKVCLVRLVEHLRTRGFELLDVQFWNPHIAQFGCVEIPRAEYLERLKRATARSVAWLPFEGKAP